MHNALWLTSRARGVEDEKRIFRVHRLCRAISGRLSHHRIERRVAAFLHRHIGVRALNNQCFHIAANRQRRINIGLQRRALAAAWCLVSRNNQGRIAARNTGR